MLENGRKKAPGLPGLEGWGYLLSGIERFAGQDNVSVLEGFKDCARVTIFAVFLGLENAVNDCLELGGGFAVRVARALDAVTGGNITARFLDALPVHVNRALIETGFGHVIDERVTLSLYPFFVLALELEPWGNNAAIHAAHVVNHAKRVSVPLDNLARAPSGLDQFTASGGDDTRIDRGGGGDDSAHENLTFSNKC